jgi:hypothetical protein
MKTGTDVVYRRTIAPMTARKAAATEPERAIAPLPGTVVVDWVGEPVVKVAVLLEPEPPEPAPPVPVG